MESNEHFGKIAKIYKKIRPSYPPITEKLSQVLNLKENMHVIDIGCGPATDLFELKEKFGIIPLGIECSREMAEEGINLIGKEAIIYSDAISYLKSKNNIADSVYLKFSTHHFPDLIQLFSVIRNALKPGGRLAIVTMLPDDVLSFDLINYFPSLKKNMHNEASRQKAIIPILNDLHFEEIKCTPREIYRLRYEKKLIELITNRFISFLNKVPEDELSQGIKKLSYYIDSLTSPIEIGVNGTTIHARKEYYIH